MFLLLGGPFLLGRSFLRLFLNLPLRIKILDFIVINWLYIGYRGLGMASTEAAIGDEALLGLLLHILLSTLVNVIKLIFGRECLAEALFHYHLPPTVEPRSLQLLFVALFDGGDAGYLLWIRRRRHVLLLMLCVISSHLGGEM